VLLCALLCGCPADSEDRQPKGPGPEATVKRTAAKKALPAIDAMSLSQMAVFSRLGAHRLTCKSTLQTKVSGAAPRVVTQQMVLSVDAKGSFSAAKHTGQQHGQEVVWTGGWLYPRQRHGKFLRRRPRTGEPREIADRLAGYLPAYVELLSPHLVLKPQGETTHEQRKALRVSLALAPGAAKPGAAATAPRRWRQTIKVQSLEGMILLDAQTRVPLSVDLTAAWSFTPPPAGLAPASGIPTRLDTGKAGAMTLRFNQRVTHVGKVELIRPPAAAQVMDPRRVRLERERQMFSGEIPIPQQRPRRAQ